MDGREYGDRKKVEQRRWRERRSGKDRRQSWPGKGKQARKQMSRPKAEDSFGDEMKMSKEKIEMGLAVIEARERLGKIREIIERVENRCMAADGVVENTRFEMSDDELREIYRLSKNQRKPTDMLDAAMLIKRLLHRVVKDNPGLPYPPIVAQGKGWLLRKGLEGSPLRKK